METCRWKAHLEPTILRADELQIVHIHLSQLLTASEVLFHAVLKIVINFNEMKYFQPRFL